MAVPAKEPIFTTRGWLAYGAMCVIYAAILFSLDPQWVAWAAPLAFGGALVATDPPPASAHLGLSPGLMVMAWAFSIASLLALALLGLTRSWPRLRWLACRKDEDAHRTLARVWNYMTSLSGLPHGR